MNEQFGITISVQLLARRLGEYTVYVFKDLDTLQLITVTKLPNWQGEPDIDIGKEGFLTYHFVRADKDSWRDKVTGELVNYKFSGNYYQSFLPNSPGIKDNTAALNGLVVG